MSCSKPPGCGKAARKPARSTSTAIDIDASIADAAGELARRYRRSHTGIDTTDYLIAAAAQSVSATVVTLDVRHFPMFPGLTPAYD